MRIGLDFDNTIACYDDAFVAVACEMGLVAADFRGSKKAVRDAIRSGSGGDIGWQKLQARVYGPQIGRATLAPGVDILLGRARQRNIPVVIVSYKTQFSPFDAETDLRVAAMAWMKENGLLDFDKTGVRAEDVFFETTRLDKIRRLKAAGCTHFVDDLDEVFNEPEFPRDVMSYLYAAGYDELPAGRFRAFRTHLEIADHLFGVDPVAAATALCGAEPESVVRVANGRNNRLYCVAAQGGIVALKSYPSPDDDPRDRIGTEFAALSFLAAQGETAVPAALAINRPMKTALYEWIEGEPIGRASTDDIDQILAFTRRLKDYRNAAAGAELPLASEACLSAAELTGQIDARIGRLDDVANGDPALKSFLDRLRKLKSRLAGSIERHAGGLLAVQHRTLSPSDFGLHNALRRHDGRIVFLDFEYFGWDDPVKLTADLLLHPAMQFDADQRAAIARGMADIFSDDPDFRARLQRLLPLYALRWCLIMLNEFLPERWARRAVAGEVGHQEAKARQLAKAEVMLSRAEAAAGDVL